MRHAPSACMDLRENLITAEYEILKSFRPWPNSIQSAEISFLESPTCPLAVFCPALDDEVDEAVDVDAFDDSHLQAVRHDPVRCCLNN